MLPIFIKLLSFVYQQLLNTRNINQIFQLLFNILVNCDQQTTRQYAVDLFTDLLRTHSHVQHSIMKSVPDMI